VILKVAVDTIKRKAHRGDRAITTDNITADIVACIAEAFREVIRLVPKRFLHDSSTIAVTAGVAGTPSVWSLASTCQEPIYFHYTDGGNYRKLSKITSDHEWLDQVWEPASPVNLPNYFREIGPDASGNRQIEIFPVPSKDLTISYEFYKRHTADMTVANLSGDDQEIPLIPDLYHDAVEKGGLYLFLKGFDDQAAQIALQDYEKAKLDLTISDENDLDDDITFRYPTKGASPLNTARFS